jgi:hypothetical protein
MVQKVKSYLLGGFVLVLVAGTAYFTYDLLFTQPIMLEGTIIEKAYIARQNSNGPSLTPYNQHKSYDYVVQTHQHHYDQKQVSDNLRFKEYTGGLLGIEYSANNEEAKE